MGRIIYLPATLAYVPSFDTTCCVLEKRYVFSLNLFDKRSMEDRSIFFHLENNCTKCTIIGERNLDKKFKCRRVKEL